ncbi:MAG: sugar phosphate isomerase/epimerase [Chloroflexia bacterium]|nr:sugar phosphate isomerase/epimerase [Chloroflexia bacterium]
MSIVLFTKLFKGKDLDEMADVASSLGFDGIDLLIRSGFQVEPAQPEGLRGAVERLKQSGLTVPMATTDLTDPNQIDTERLFAAVAECGIGAVRLGYWKYDPATGYAATLETARRHLDTLVEFAAAAGIRLAIQLHGGTIHASGAQTLALLDGYDPAVLGAYPDPGNQVVQDGREDWRFTFEILRPWLAAVGVKNGGWFPSTLAESGQRTWHSDWLGLDEGMVPWDDIVAHLKRTGFDGIYTLHSHYEVPYSQVLDKTRLDLNYVRRLLSL